MIKPMTPFTLTVDCVACGGMVNLKFSRTHGDLMDAIFECIDDRCGCETRLEGRLMEVKPSKPDLNIIRRESAAGAI